MSSTNPITNTNNNRLSDSSTTNTTHNSLTNPSQTPSDKSSETPTMGKGGHAVRATAKTLRAVSSLLGGLAGRALRVGVAVVALPLSALTTGTLSAFDEVIFNEDVPFTFGILPIIYMACSTVYHGVLSLVGFATGIAVEDEYRTDNIGQKLSPFSDKGKAIKFEDVATMFSSITKTDIPFFDDKGNLKYHNKTHNNLTSKHL